MKKTIALVGTLDTKESVYSFIKDIIETCGSNTLLIDAGVMKEPTIAVDIPRAAVAQAGGVDIRELVAQADRGHAIEIMGRGVAALLARLYSEGRLDGVIAFGGGGGTSIATRGMRALPLGVPKVMVSTMAGRDVSGFVGLKDIVMIPSIVDITGINRITREIFTRAAGAICGMVETNVVIGQDKPLIAATMFGNTTTAVETARSILETKGLEVVVFPCSGTSGKTMESLIESGYFTAILDITTTEWADELVGGVLSAGPDRMNAAAETGTPQVVVPGCLDMVNFWAPETVPERFKNRLFYRHNPNITLMRTNVEECRKLGVIIAEKLNRSKGPVMVFLPLEGLSMLDSPGGPFWWPDADSALFTSIKSSLRNDIPVVEMGYNINDPEFAVGCAEALLKMIPGVS
jgi:uncharacterized protein (UPF0261 family)